MMPKPLNQLKIIFYHSEKLILLKKLTMLKLKKEELW